MNGSEEREVIGRGKPPVSTRFQKGKSGNPKGRPKNKKRALPYDHVLGQMVTVREDGRERRVTAAEAFLLQLTKRGLEGDGPSMRAFLHAMETVRPRRSDPDSVEVIRIIFQAFGPGIAAGTLGIATKRYGLDETRARWELRAWIVQAALARLGNSMLSEDDQREVWENTHQPWKVNWPAWWTYRG